MLFLLCWGLLAVSSVMAEEEEIDLSGMTSRIQIENNRNWFPQPGIPGIGVGIDSSEHGVTPGRRNPTCKCGWANRSPGRIIGGKVHAPNEYPFIAGVAHSRSPNRPHCGSSIISPWHIITAAHCTAGATSLVVTLGEYNRQFRTGQTVTHAVRRIIDHPQYNPQTLKHDISLLVLAQPIKESPIIGLVCLPTRHVDLSNKNVRIIGWGAMQFNGPMTMAPQKVDVTVTDMYSCSRYWPQHIIPNPPTQICTHSPGKTACQGDSGGPVVYLNPETNRYTLVGLVSFGPHCKTDLPSVQTSVGAYIPWIMQNIQATTPGQQTCN